LCAAVLEVADPDLQCLQGDVGRGHQPVNQPAAQELLLAEMSGAARSLVPDEHSSPCDRAQASNQSDVEVTPLSYRQEVSISPQFVESHATLRNTEDFVDVGHSASDITVREARDQESDEAAVLSSSLMEVSSDLILRIATKLREFETVSKELEDLLCMMKAQRGTAEEDSRIEQKNMTDSKIDPCKNADPKNDKPTVSESQIKGHSDGKKTKFDASKVHVSEYLAWKLYSICRELQVMCETVSSVLPSTLGTLLKCGILRPKFARPYLHLAEITSLLTGFSSKLRSAVGHMMNNISGSNIKEITYLSLAIKELTAILPLLETECRNLYSECVQDCQPSDCHSDAEARSEIDTICHQMDVAYEHLEKAMWKMNMIRDNEAASSEIPLHPETGSEQVDPKDVLFVIARKFLSIEKHISSLIEARTFQGQAE
jgi:membrane-associated HD superfamily phosphohydrolase